MIGLRTGFGVMMQLGGYQFSVNAAAYQELRRRAEYRWAEVDRMGQRAALQYTGPGADTVTLSGVIFPEYRGGTGQPDAMRSLAASGAPQTLIDGEGRILGRFVIESVEETQTVFADKGRPRRQEFTLQLRRRD